MRQRATAINLATTVTPIDPITHPQYWFYQKLKLSQAEQYLDLIESSPIQYPSSIESSRIPTLNTGFKISGDMTKLGSFYIGFVLVCKQQNQSGTKTFRIRNEFGTISSSVNLVLKLKDEIAQNPIPRLISNSKCPILRQEMLPR